MSRKHKVRYAGRLPLGFDQNCTYACACIFLVSTTITKELDKIFSSCEKLDYEC